MVPWSLPSPTNNVPNSTKKMLIRKVASAPPIGTNSNVCLNEPESPPVLSNPCLYDNNCRTSSPYEIGFVRSAINDNEERCRSCNSTKLVTDWSQGDRVCTNCGVVAEGHLMDDRAEWKDYNETEDIIKGLPSKSRSGLSIVDETKYIGGLQPTILSKEAFGKNSGGYKMAKIRSQLKVTNKRLDYIMGKVHKRALEDAKLERRVRLKKEIKKVIGGSTKGIRNSDRYRHSEVRPEFDMIIIQEEDKTINIQAAIYAEKWSLDRAIFLFGTSEDTRLLNQSSIVESREDLFSRMDKTLLCASRDLYSAYTMFRKVARRLCLPNRVVDEVVHRFVRYTARRDGFTIKGISTRFPYKNGKGTKEEKKIAATRLKEHNKIKQMSSLGAAIIFLTSRALGSTRTIVEVCDCFKLSSGCRNDAVDLKPKDCSCAINEIKSYFPEYTRIPINKDSHSSDGISISNFSDHFIRNLQLPPVAEACVRTLLIHCKNEQVKFGVNSGIKTSTLCATITYFVCIVGTAMQKVAHQVNLKKNGVSKDFSELESSKMRSRSIERFEPCIDAERRQIPKAVRLGIVNDSKRSHNFIKYAETGNDEDSKNYDSDSESFDVFSHAPIVEDQPEILEYDMRLMWDAWAEQMSWSRSLLEIEQSCRISSSIILNLYKSDMYPRRESLLDVLKATVTADQGSKIENTSVLHSTLRQTPLASILLAHISTVGMLMSGK